MKLKQTKVKQRNEKGRKGSGIEECGLKNVGRVGKKRSIAHLKKKKKTEQNPEFAGMALIVLSDVSQSTQFPGFPNIFHINVFKLNRTLKY